MAASTFRSYIRRLLRIFPKPVLMMKKFREMETVIILTHVRKTLDFFLWAIVLGFSGGLLFFHIIDKFNIPNQPIFDYIYYCWDKAGWCMVFALLFLIFKPYRNVIAPVFLYTIVRLCFQVHSTITKTDMNARYITNTLYLILLAIFICECIKELMQAIKDACQRK